MEYLGLNLQLQVIGNCLTRVVLVYISHVPGSPLGSSVPCIMTGDHRLHAHCSVIHMPSSFPLDCNCRLKHVSI